MNGKLHPHRSLVASGTATKELVVRNYKLGGQVEGKVEFSDAISQIEYSPCGHYLFVICGTLNLAVIRAFDFGLVGSWQIPAGSLQSSHHLADFLFHFEYNSAEQLKYIWLLSNEVKP